MLGDLNAKFRHENVNKPALENHGVHQQSKNKGIQLLEFALSKNMLVNSTMFSHLRIHKDTWISLDGHTVNQIDYILVKKR